LPKGALRSPALSLYVFSFAQRAGRAIAAAGNKNSLTAKADCVLPEANTERHWLAIIN